MATVEQDWSWDSLYAAWRELDVPEGWHAEITEEGITVTPPPTVQHTSVVEAVQTRLHAAVLPSVAVYQRLGLSFPHLRRLYEPDLVVIPRQALEGATYSVPAAAALLVVEVTSKSNARHDRTAKRWAYAHGRVPLYLLIDPWDADGPATTLFAAPADGEYADAERVAFGQTVTLPAPFVVQVDTAKFPVP